MSSSYYKPMIESTFKEAVAILPVDPELKRAILESGRVPKFIMNMADKFVETQDIRLKRGQPLVDEITFKELVYDMTEMFCANLKKRAEELYMDEIARNAIKAEQQQLQDLEKTISSGKLTGEYEDLADSVELTNDRNSK